MANTYLITADQLQKMRELLVEAKNPNAIAGQLENQLIDIVGIHPEFVDDIAAVLRNERVLGLELTENNGTHSLLGLSSADAGSGVQIASAEIDPSVLPQEVAANQNVGTPGQAFLDLGEDEIEEAEEASDLNVGQISLDDSVPSIAELSASGPSVTDIQANIDETNENTAADDEFIADSALVDDPAPEESPSELVNAAEAAQDNPAQAESSEKTAESDNVGKNEQAADDELGQEQAESVATGMAMGFFMVPDNANNRAVIKEVRENGIQFNDGEATYMALPDGVERSLVAANGDRIPLGGHNSIRLTSNHRGETEYHLVNRLSSHNFEPVVSVESAPVKRKMAGFNYEAAKIRDAAKSEADRQALDAEQRDNKDQTTPAPGGAGGGNISGGFNLSMLNRNGAKNAKTNSAPKMSSTLSGEALGAAMLQKELLASVSTVGTAMDRYRAAKAELDLFADQGIKPGYSSEVPAMADANSDEYKAAIAKRALDVMEEQQAIVQENFAKVKDSLDLMAESGMTLDSLPQPGEVKEKLDKMVDSMKKSGEMLIGGVEMMERVKEMTDRITQMVSALLNRGAEVSNG